MTDKPQVGENTLRTMRGFEPIHFAPTAFHYEGDQPRAIMQFFTV
jgi:hypothetical protein